MSPIDGLVEETKCKDLEKIVVDDDPEKFFQVGAQLPLQEKEELIKFLGRTLTCSHGVLTKLPGWIRALSVLFECQSICHPQKATTSTLI